MSGGQSSDSRTCSAECIQVIGKANSSYPFIVSTTTLVALEQCAGDTEAVIISLIYFIFYFSLSITNWLLYFSNG